MIFVKNSRTGCGILTMTVYKSQVSPVTTWTQNSTCTAMHWWKTCPMRSVATYFLKLSSTISHRTTYGDERWTESPNGAATTFFLTSKEANTSLWPENAVNTRTHPYSWKWAMLSKMIPSSEHVMYLASFMATIPMSKTALTYVVCEIAVTTAASFGEPLFIAAVETSELNHLLCSNEKHPAESVLFCHRSKPSLSWTSLLDIKSRPAFVPVTLNWRSRKQSAHLCPKVSASQIFPNMLSDTLLISCITSSWGLAKIFSGGVNEFWQEHAHLSKLSSNLVFKFIRVPLDHNLGLLIFQNGCLRYFVA